jgi:nitroreductase
MWLAAHALNLGGVWLGEILKNRDRVGEILEAPKSYELMAVLAIGHPKHRQQKSDRKSISELVFKEL